MNEIKGEREENREKNLSYDQWLSDHPGSHSVAIPHALLIVGRGLVTSFHDIADAIRRHAEITRTRNNEDLK